MGTDVILVLTSAGVLYALWMLLGLTFRMIDLYHQRELSAADRRRGDGEQAEGKVLC